MARLEVMPGENAMLATGTLVIAAVMTATFAVLKCRRLMFYRSIADVQAGIMASEPPPLIHADAATPSFAQLLVHMPEFLPQPTFAALKAEIEGLVDTERSYLPTHKKGGTVAYETLCRQAPAVIRLYLDPAFIGFLSRLTGERLSPTPLNDQSSCSILFYERPGDHIGWHFDHNFYRGRHFTVLLAVVNRGHAEGGLSAARLIARQNGADVPVLTPPNTLVMFEGGKVEHRVTPIADDERRIMLSMTYCADPRSTLAQGIKRRVKDMAFFGVRALWT